MVRPNRAITIDRKAIAELAQILVDAAASDLKRRVYENDKLKFDRYTKLGELCRDEWVASDLGPGKIRVELWTKNEGFNPSPIGGGGFECPRLGYPNGRIKVYLNEEYPLNWFTSPDSGITRGVLNVLLHEFTHAADPRIKAFCARKVVIPQTGQGYYDDPTEVKATSAQLIGDVLPMVRWWRERGELPRFSYTTPKSGGVQAVVREILHHGPVLLQVRMDSMNPRNQARVMRDLYRALEDEGLLDEPATKKNPAGAFVSGEFWYVDGNLIEVEDHELAAPKILQGLGVRVNIDALTQLLKLGGVRIYDGMREGGVPITGLDVWRLDKPTLRSLQDVLLKLKRTGSHEVDIDVSSTFVDYTGKMEHLHLTAADVLEATSVRELYAQGMVAR
jgi:hypothetical protein